MFVNRGRTIVNVLSFDGGGYWVWAKRLEAGRFATCTLQGVDPYTYLVDVLHRVGEHPASRAVDLTPRVWKTLFAADPLRSDLERGRDRPPPSVWTGQTGGAGYDAAIILGCASAVGLCMVGGCSTLTPVSVEPFPMQWEITNDGALKFCKSKDDAGGMAGKVLHETFGLGQRGTRTNASIRRPSNPRQRV